MLAIFGALLAARSVAVSFAYSPTVDEPYHLERGVRYWHGDLAGVELNDPPFGEAVIALPLVVMQRLAPAATVSWTHPTQAVQAAVAAWKALLFLPSLAVAWLWARRLYGPAAGWAACALLSVEPNFAAHLPLATLDVPGVTAIMLACYLAWRYFEAGGARRLTAAAVASGAAMMVKHTAVILPGVWAAYAALYWVGLPWCRGAGEWRYARHLLPRRAVALFAAAAVGGLTIWALTGFDVSRPYTHPDWPRSSPRLFSLLSGRWPAGTYLSSFIYGYVHGKEGHPTFLLGRTSLSGWWYYFPVVAWYKVPVAVAAMMLIGTLWLAARRGRAKAAEWSLAIPAFAWTAFLMSSRINIGFRHFLPAYAFLLLLAAVRWLASEPAGGSRARAALAWMAIGLTALHAALWHPDYIPYVNAPRQTPPYLAISDSNIDWGQGFKELSRWLDRRGAPEAAEPTYVIPFPPSSPAVLLPYTKGRVVVLEPTPALPDPPLPRTGTLVVSADYLGGQLWCWKSLKALGGLPPQARIGQGALLVYDLAKLPSTATATTGAASR
jgi:hypothetical protein